MAGTYRVPLACFVFKQTVSHLTTESNVEQVFSREWKSLRMSPICQSPGVQNLIRFPMRINNLSDQDMKTVSVSTPVSSIELGCFILAVT